jgi:hypothetical protein
MSMASAICYRVCPKRRFAPPSTWGRMMGTGFWAPWLPGQALIFMRSKWHPRHSNGSRIVFPRPGNGQLTPSGT